MSVSTWKQCALAALVGTSGFAAEPAPASALPPTSNVYDALIAPIFQARCVECHGERKQKAKLGLHAWEAFVKGSESGPVFVPAKVDESTIVERLRLAVDEEEHMPPSDKPQPERAEIEVIARWIERGAARNLTVADLAFTGPMASAVMRLPAVIAAVPRPRVVYGDAELDPVAVAKLRAPLAAKVAELQRRFPGALNYESRSSAALHFTAAGFGSAFGDAEWAQLAPVADALVVVDVSRTGVTDAVADVLARCKQLRVFRGGFTALGDATGRALASLPALEVIALPETQVSEASVAGWTKLRALRALRIADTAAARAAQDANLPVAPSAADLVPPVEAKPLAPAITAP